MSISVREGGCVATAQGKKVVEARSCCRESMRGILVGDLSRVHPFVVSLLEMLTLGMPDPRDKAGFVQHVSSRTACVLGDLFALATGGEEGEEEREGREGGAAEVPALPSPSPVSSTRSMLQVPLCVAGGALMSNRIVAPALVAGCLVHPSVSERVGFPPLCALIALPLLAWSAATLDAGSSFLAGALFVDATSGFPLLTACTHGWRRSRSRPSPS